MFEEKKTFAGKVTKITKMIVRIVAFEGLQPMVTEAFLKGDNIQCGLDAVKKSNEEILDCRDRCVQHYWFCSSDLSTFYSSGSTNT